MIMRICDVCRKIVRSGGTRHPGCQQEQAYRSLMHQRMSAVYRINNVPCVECQRTGTPENPITAHHVEPLARRLHPREDRPEDYAPLCRVCNSIRGSKVGTE